MRQSHELAVETAAASAAPPGKRKTRVDLSLADWGMSLNTNSKKFELYRAKRPDLAHLTLSWGTASGDVDVHLTYEHERAMKDDGEKDWRPLFRLTREDLAAFDLALPRWMEHLLSGYDSRYRRFRPGWLNRNGYLIHFVPKAKIVAWGSALAPRRGGKHRLDPTAFLDPSRHPAAFRESLYTADILHDIDGSTEAHPIQAFSVDGCLDRTILLGRRLGHTGWWGMTYADSQAISNRVLTALFDVVVARRRPEHADAFEKLVAGLGLEEAEATRDIAAEVRGLLRDGRHPLRSPRKERSKLARGLVGP